MQNKYMIMSDIFVGESLSIAKYEPNKVANGLNHATFFVASNDIDVTDLQRYREQTESQFLIGINTTGKECACLNIADNVLHCLPDEIELAMLAFKLMPNGYGFIGIDWYDVATAISSGRLVEFIHSHMVDANCVENACNSLIQKLHEAKSDKQRTSAMISIFADSSFTFEYQEIITNKLNENLNVDLANIYYQVNFFDEFNYWESSEQGCCIGVFLIYSNKAYEVQASNNKEQKDNAIQAYLKRQLR